MVAFGQLIRMRSAGQLKVTPGHDAGAHPTRQSTEDEAVFCVVGQCQPLHAFAVAHILWLGEGYELVTHGALIDV